MSARGNVLVVEDDADTGETVVAVLKRAGFGTRLVTSRDAALFAVSLYIYDFILLDVSMPGITIDEFLKRSHEFRTAIVILMSSALVIQREATRLGVQHTLKKPFGPDELLELLSQIAPSKMNSRTDSAMPR
jgi:DNA-binding response OmpR family regulator